MVVVIVVVGCVGRLFIVVIFILLHALTFSFVNAVAANPHPDTAPLRPCPAAVVDAMVIVKVSRGPLDGIVVPILLD